MAKKSVLDTKKPVYYCRRCAEIKQESDFYAATDPLDTNGKMSVCKNCCGEIYAECYATERTIDKAIYETCRKLNVLYIQSAVEAAKSNVANALNEGKDVGNVFSLYRRVLSSHARGTVEDGVTLTFHEAKNDTAPSIAMPMDTQGIDMVGNLQKYWGTGFILEQYQFLEEQLVDWQHSYKCDTKAELELFKEICFKQLEIAQERSNGKGKTAALVKELQELMKTASIDPVKAKAADSGKAQSTFSDIIKMIEETEPASYYDDRPLFPDFKDDKQLEHYFNKYVKRPLKNFVTQSRDFSVEADEEEEDDESLVDLGTETESS